MLKKTILYLIVLSMFIGACSSLSEEQKYDTYAIENLDEMSEMIGELSSCSYTLNTTINKLDESDDLINNIRKHDVYMRGPDKLYIHSSGTLGKKSYWYNGSRFSCFSYEESAFDTIPVRGNVLEAMDYIHHKFGIDFPAADFFYPSLTDDLMKNFNSVLYIGDDNKNGMTYIVIEASNKNKTLEIWIEKESLLPYKLSMKSNDDSGISYEGIFSNWRVDPYLPDMLFEYKPSANSKRKNLPSLK